MTEILYAAAVLVFPAVMIYSALSDLFTMQIRNRLSLILIAAFFVAALVSGLPAATLGYHVLVAAVVLAAGIAFMAAGWVGGGDAKIATAIALWMGPTFILPFLMAASLAGGALTLAIMIFRKIPLPATTAQIPWVERLYRPTNGVPYGIALAAGAPVVFVKTPWFEALAPLL